MLNGVRKCGFLANKTRRVPLPANPRKKLISVTTAAGVQSRAETSELEFEVKLAISLSNSQMSFSGLLSALLPTEEQANSQGVLSKLEKNPYLRDNAADGRN